jgi:hypothetical protein
MNASCDFVAGGDAVSDGRSAGFASASVPDGYVRYMLPQVFEPWAADLVSRAVLRPGQSVLDVASDLGPRRASGGQRGRPNRARRRL